MFGDAGAVLSTVTNGLAPVQQQVSPASPADAGPLSFAVHIPLVCIGIALPAMVLFAEWLHHRTGDELYRTIQPCAGRGVMAALFAVGVITGHAPELRDGPAVAELHRPRSASVFGLAFEVEGFSFFIQGDSSSGILHLRLESPLAPRVPSWAAVPIVITGFTGSLMVASRSTRG